MSRISAWSQGPSLPAQGPPFQPRSKAIPPFLDGDICLAKIVIYPGQKVHMRAPSADDDFFRERETMCSSKLTDVGGSQLSWLSWLVIGS